MSSISKSKFFILICLLINASFLNCEEGKMEETAFEKRLEACEKIVQSRLAYDMETSSGLIMNIKNAYSLNETEGMARAKTFLNLSCNKKVTQEILKQVNYFLS